MQNKKAYATFRESFPFYLSRHQNTTCRVLHYIGSWFVLIIRFAGALTGNFLLWLLMPAAGYGFAWVGHYFFEKTGRRPLPIPFTV